MLFLTKLNERSLLFMFYFHIHTKNLSNNNNSGKIFSSFLFSLNSFLIMSDKQIILHKDFCFMYIKSNVKSNVKTYSIVKKTNCSESACYLSRIRYTIPFSLFSKERKETRDKDKIIKLLILFFTKG